ncbi:MAG: CxxxxCH/CxxCH domain-containing protein [Bacteroidota bacterium]|nr:CxxxxCH/CxxCH domain-containing protein [Bacteroidota bacterium]
MKKLFPLIFIIAVIITVNSCRRDNYQPICYGNDIQPILTRGCTNVGCHSSGSSAGGYNFTTYEGVIGAVMTGNASKSELYKAIKGSHPKMPKEGTPLTRKEVNMIKAWIDFGANDCASTNTIISNCDTVNVKYDSHIKPLMTSFCTNCHFAGGQSPALDTYNSVKSAVNIGSFLPAVKHTGPFQMPKSSAKLSNCNIAKIDKWVQAGMPQ